MVNQVLADYIKRQKDNGIPDKEVRDALLAVGWDPQEVEAAFSSLATPLQDNILKLQNNPIDTGVKPTKRFSPPPIYAVLGLGFFFLLTIIFSTSLSRQYIAQKQHAVAQNTPRQTNPPIAENIIPASPEAEVLAETAPPVPKNEPSAGGENNMKVANAYKIAVIGDSMVDTMGENLDYLQKSLENKYPNMKFELYNYGIGGQNVVDGMQRFDKEFTNRERKFKPIPEISARIIIVGSFSYNTFSPHDAQLHKETLEILVEKAKKTGAEVYMLAEIAPLKTGFGKGVGGVNWPEDRAAQQAANIIEQLENTLDLARNKSVALIDSYTPSKVEGNFGNPKFVDGHDGIHPSIEGHKFIAETIVSTIQIKP